MTDLSDISVCPPIGPNRRTLIAAQMVSWLTSVPMHELASLYEVDLNRPATLHDTLATLQPLIEKWDFRRAALQAGTGQPDDRSELATGAARWSVGTAGLSERDEPVAMESLRDLGLWYGRQPRHTKYDLIVVLGGARLSGLLRAQLVRRQVEQGYLQPASVVLLGSTRPITDGERDATNTYAPAAETELDLMVAGAEQEFGIDAATAVVEDHRDTQQPNLNWSIKRFAPVGVGPAREVVAVAAPSSAPRERRANTADAYRFFVEHWRLAAQARLLLVTTQHYVPYQHLEAVRNLALPYDIELETVGVPVEWLNALQRPLGVAHLLQEVRSAVQAAGRLYQQHLSGSASY